MTALPTSLPPAPLPLRGSCYECLLWMGLVPHTIGHLPVSQEPSPSYRARKKQSRDWTPSCLIPEPRPGLLAPIRLPPEARTFRRNHENTHHAVAVSQSLPDSATWPHASHPHVTEIKSLPRVTRLSARALGFEPRSSGSGVAPTPTASRQMPTPPPRATLCCSPSMRCRGMLTDLPDRLKGKKPGTEECGQEATVCMREPK